MAFLGRHVGLVLRFWACALAIGVLQAAPRAQAQVGPGAGGGPGMAGLPSFTPDKSKAPVHHAPVIPQERVLDIRIIGNNAISRDKVLANMGTRIDRPYDQGTFDRDVRKLVGKNWFVDVVPSRERVPGGIVITLRVVERPTLKYVKFLGNKRIRVGPLSKEVGLKAGDSMDTYAIEEGKRKLELLYHTKGFNDASVTILEGTKATDPGAIYLINEGRKQKVWSVKFEGNNVATDGRLKTQIQSKPPILWVFKGEVDRRKIEEDVDRLTTYYRGLGYFKAHVGYDYEWNTNEDWMTLVFFINEGPRYLVRNISFIGNKIYGEEVLAAEMELTPGDYYDLTKMTKDIGYFKDLYGANGYVFADAEPEIRFFEEPGQLDVVYKVSEGKQCLVGDINVHISGDNPHTKLLTAINRIELRPGDIIDIRKVRASERRIQRSALFNTDPTKGDLPKIVLSPPDPEDESMMANQKKKKQTAQRRPGGIRGQSPDNWPAASSPGWQNPPASQSPPRSTPPAYRPLASPSIPGGTVRGQSPDGYGGYGGQNVNPISPQPQTYTANQPPSTQPEIVGAPPPGTIYNGQPPIYGQQPVYGQQPPAGMLPSPENDPLLGGTGFMDDRPVIPFDVYLSEAQTGRFMLGAGVNSNAGLIGSIILDEQNFDIWRWPSSWEDFRTGRAFRGAGQKFRIEAAPGTQVSRYMFNFVEPYLFDTPVSFGVSGYFFNRFYRNWNEQRLGGRTSIGYQFTPDLSGNFSVRAEDVLISNPSTLGVPALDEVLGHTQIYSFMPQIAHDTRDNTFLPTEGHYISADFEYAIGTFQFPRWTVDFRQHFLLRQRPDGSGRHTLSLYNAFGITGSDTPIYERFFAGGFSTLRGFQFRGASPMQMGVEVGGDFQNLSSIEYMFPVTGDDMVRMVAFCDFGTVEESVTINWRNFRVAPGLGFRIQLPALGPAPIALDFAVPVQYAPTDLRQVFSFFVGYSR